MEGSGIASPKQSSDCRSDEVSGSRTRKTFRPEPRRPRIVYLGWELKCLFLGNVYENPREDSPYNYEPAQISRHCGSRAHNGSIFDLLCTALARGTEQPTAACVTLRRRRHIAPPLRRRARLVVQASLRALRPLGALFHRRMARAVGVARRRSAQGVRKTL